MQQAPQGMIRKMAQDVGMVQKYHGIIPTLFENSIPTHVHWKQESKDDIGMVPRLYYRKCYCNKPRKVVLQIAKTHDSLCFNI